MTASDHEPTGAALEYWFWTLHQPGLALLVDFIVRREPATLELRVARWVDGVGSVERRFADEWSIAGPTISLDGGRLEPDGSAGRVGAVAWELAWDRGPHLVDPRPRGPLHPLDLEALIRPSATFSGFVSVDDRRWDVDAAPGMLDHYWGPRLFDRWTWISATGFVDDPDRRLEAFVARSRVFGRTPPVMPLGYLWVGGGRDDDGEMTVSPVTGLVRSRRDGERIRLRSLRLDGKRHQLDCWAPADTFVDLGEGIRTTLLGDADLDGRSARPGTVGLEFRRG